MNHRIPGICALFFLLMLTGCHTLQLKSAPFLSTPTIDGTVSEWSSQNFTLLDELVLTGISNDDKNLYMTFNISDPDLRRTVMMSRLNLKLISRDSDRQFAVFRFPVIDRESDSDDVYWEVQATGFAERHRYLMGEQSEWGAITEMTRTPDQITFELAVPLLICTGESWKDINGKSGIKFELKTGSMDSIEPRRGGPGGGPPGEGGSPGGGGGPDGMGGSGMGRGGMSGGGGPPGGSRTHGPRHEPVHIELKGILELI